MAWCVGSALAFKCPMLLSFGASTVSLVTLHRVIAGGLGILGFAVSILVFRGLESGLEDLKMPHSRPVTSRMAVARAASLEPEALLRRVEKLVFEKRSSARGAA